MSAHNIEAVTMSDDYIITTQSMTEEPTESTGSTAFTHMKIHSDKIAQIDSKTGKTDTFGELLERCIRTALHMSDKNIKREHIISMCTNNHMDAAVPFISTQFLGAKIAPLDPCLSSQEITYLLNVVRPNMIFADPESVTTLEEVFQKHSLHCEIVVFGQTKNHTEFCEFLKPHKKEKEFEPAKIENLKDVGFVYFSSGSTGLPKGICLSHYSFLGQVELCGDPNSCGLKSVKNFLFLTYGSLYWSVNGILLFRSIMRGYCRLLCENFDAKEIWDLIQKYKPTTIIILPDDVTPILANRRKSIDVQCVSRIEFVGAHTPKENFRKIREAFPQAYVTLAYGQTEAGTITMFDPDDDAHRAIETKPEKIASSGLPVRGITYKVVDLESKKNLRPMQLGELRIKSNFIMSGYHNEDSSEAFDEEGWLKTGDIVYYDEDFCFYIVDRIKEACKYQGWFISPTFLENELLKHPAVKQAVVVGIPKEDGDYAMGLVVIHDGFQVCEKAIEEFVEGRVLERQRLRGGVKFIKHVPVTNTGKVKRRELRGLVLAGKL